MKKVVMAALCLAVPGLFILNTWQGYRYNASSDRIDDLEKQQEELLAANRDLIGEIAYETSPERVAEKAAALGLVPGAEAADAGAAGVTRLAVPADSAGGSTR